MSIVPSKGNPAALRIALQEAADAVQRAAASALRAHGLSSAQYELLALLEGMRCGCCGEGECRCETSYLCQNDVSDRIASTKGNVSGLVQRLVEQGLISREPNPADRRYNAVRITASGRRVLLAARPDVETAVAERLDSLSAEEARNLTALLSRITSGQTTHGPVIFSRSTGSGEGVRHYARDQRQTEE